MEYTDLENLAAQYNSADNAFGLEGIAKAAAEVGVDGLLITDIVDNEFQDMSRVLEDQGLDLISLVAPTTKTPRLERILAGAPGIRLCDFDHRNYRKQKEFGSRSKGTCRTRPKVHGYSDSGRFRYCKSGRC